MPKKRDIPSHKKNPQLHPKISQKNIKKTKTSFEIKTSVHLCPDLVQRLKNCDFSKPSPSLLRTKRTKNLRERIESTSTIESIKEETNPANSETLDCSLSIKIASGCKKIREILMIFAAFEDKLYSINFNKSININEFRAGMFSLLNKALDDDNFYSSNSYVDLATSILFLSLKKYGITPSRFILWMKNLKITKVCFSDHFRRKKCFRLLKKMQKEEPTN